ncbi:MAG: hypothetical protein IPM79_17070 [Polyangiaceae bacterium]|nr:hypothetical protein [Polyangiaceae bacterium]MBK8939284.1 hypothetical protein [Polyangiaceae bacterium]
MPSWRLDILCEDRRTERFVRQLCERSSIQVLEVHSAPSARGDASAWVRLNYPIYAAKLRSKNFQRKRGLLVVIDGDNHGFAARKIELDEQLKAAHVPPRAPADPIAIFVPTWSIETWLSELCGRGPVLESQPLKDASADRDLWADGQSEKACLQTAANAWRKIPTSLPSLEDAYSEGSRFQM